MRHFLSEHRAEIIEHRYCVGLPTHGLRSSAAGPGAPTNRFSIFANNKNRIVARNTQHIVYALCSIIYALIKNAPMGAFFMNTFL
ncbi:MAG: hypothetical protein FWC51_04590 [Proteobacteria bacterium]|nr:hypothetical protein [Pseudomonadota bacterium]